MLKCSICGYPAQITYQELDPETKRSVQKTETVNCMEHLGVHPAFWNRHRDHGKYRLFYSKLKARLRQPYKEISAEEIQHDYPADELNFDND